jgi:integrase
LKRVCDAVKYIGSKDEIFLSQGYLKVTKGKTRSSIRRVHLTDKAKKVLSARMNKFDGEYLFPQNDKDGQKATYNLIQWHLKTIRRLGFNFRLYDCRHTFATRAVEKGIDLVVLASILGHANLKMKMRYVHPSEKQKADAIRKMETVSAKAV